MSTSRRATLAGCYALVAVMSVPVADLALRLLGDRPSRDLKGLYAQRPNGSYHLAKGVRTSAEFYSGPMEVTTDSLGLRSASDQTRWHRRGDTTDILLLGDSQAFGNNLNWPETIAGQLDSLAALAGQRAANAGTGGHALQDQVDLAEALIVHDSLVPRKIVVLFTPLMVNRPGVRNRARVGEDGRLYDGNPDGLRRLRMWLKMNTAVYTRARGALRYARERLLSSTRSGDDRDPGVVGLYDVRNRTAGKRDSLAAQLATLRALGATVGAETYVAYLPLATEADFGNVANAARDAGMSVAAEIPELIMRDAAAFSKVRVLSLRAALDTAVARGNPLTVIADPHYSAQVSALIARSLWMGLQSTRREESHDQSR